MHFKLIIVIVEDADTTDAVLALMAKHLEPDAVAVDGGGNVYVADTDNNRVVKCNAWGWCPAAFTFDTGINDIGGISGPLGVATDSSGNVYVSDTGNDRIVKSDSTGNVIAIWSTFGH